MSLIGCTCEADTRTCSIHPVHRGRRFFLIGALALPAAAHLELPMLEVPTRQRAWRLLPGKPGSGESDNGTLVCFKGRPAADRFEYRHIRTFALYSIPVQQRFFGTTPMGSWTDIGPAVQVRKCQT